MTQPPERPGRSAALTIAGLLVAVVLLLNGCWLTSLPMIIGQSVGNLAIDAGIAAQKHGEAGGKAETMPEKPPGRVP
jgi:hypothetical protein